MKEVCGTCKHNKRTYDGHCNAEFCCGNENSDNYAVPTFFNDTCDDWEVEMSDNVNNPSHYCTGKYECIEVMQEVFGTEAVKHFMLLNSFKYLWRTDRKNGTEDIEKAERYLSMYLKLNREEPTVKADPDKMTLATAFEIPEAWMMVWAGEPDRNVEVTMTYEDLKIIFDMVKKRREEREPKRSDPDA